MVHAQHRSGREHLGIRQFGAASETRLEMDEEEAAELTPLAASDEASVQSKDGKDANEFVARETSIEV